MAPGSFILIVKGHHEDTEADNKLGFFRKKAKYQMIHELDKGQSRFLLPQKTPTFSLIHIHISFSRCR